MIDTGRILDVAKAQLEGDPQAGAALCAIVAGQEIVNAQWGLADASRGTRYDSSSLQYPMSMTKGVIGAVLALTIDRGHIDPLQRVAHYWPEFGTPAKRDISVEQLMSHQAGLPFIDGGYSIEGLNDRDGFAARLAAQEPLWEPGTNFGYHCWTFGNYADILLEKATGSGLAGWLAELRNLLGIEIYQGLPRQHWHRAVRLLWPDIAHSGNIDEMTAAIAPDSLTYKMAMSFPETFDPDGFYGGEAIRSLACPADNLFLNAHGLARLYGFLASGGIWQGHRLCSAEAIETVTRERVRGTDPITGVAMAFGLGFQKPSEAFPFSDNPKAFGHAGAGGQIAFADPDISLSVAWMPTRFTTDDPDLRWQRVFRSIHEELADSGPIHSQEKVI